MGKTNSCNLQEDEILAEEVRKYPCLYDKSDKGYKERDRNSNAWKAIESALGYEEGIASKRFDALRKRFNKRKKQLHEVSRSGSGTSDVAESTQNLKEYSFLAWLNPYIKPRKTNIDIGRDSIGNDDCETESIVTQNEGNENGSDSILDDDNESGLKSSPKSLFITTPEGNNGIKRGPTITYANTKPAKKMKQELQQTELEMVKTMTKVMHQKLERVPNFENSLSTDELFGKLVASELKQLPNSLRIMAKHEINNIIHKFQVQANNLTIQQNRSPPNTPTPSPFSTSTTSTNFPLYPPENWMRNYNNNNF